MNNAYTLAWCLQHPLQTPANLMQITMETDWNVFSNYSYYKKTRKSHTIHVQPVPRAPRCARMPCGRSSLMMSRGLILSN
jgi:hypothetical protein